MAAVLNSASNAINQIYDLEIDRVNKPKRPLPSGSLGLREAWWFTVACFGVAWALAWLAAKGDDRVAAATTLAARLNALVVLKGAGSVCASPDGTWHINTSGNPGMASAGMGDVLTGIIAALLAQGAEPKTAFLAGVYLHGAAADRAVTEGAGTVGLTASETVNAARALLNRR